MAEAAGKERGAQAQELMTQGKEVVAEYYEEGRHQVLAWQQQLEHQRISHRTIVQICNTTGQGAAQTPQELSQTQFP